MDDELNIDDGNEDAFPELVFEEDVTDAAPDSTPAKLESAVEDDDVKEDTSPANEESDNSATDNTPEGEVSDDAATVKYQDIERADLLKVRVNTHEFLVSAAEVAEIIRPLPLTPAPMAPDHILGLANVRGQVVCIIDPTKVLALSGKYLDETPLTRFLLLRHRRMHVGLWVDEISRLYQINKDELPETPDSNTVFSGEIDCDGKPLQVMNVSAVIS